MAGHRGSVAELCYAAEGLSGTAASTSLRKLGTLMDAAPSGRLFGAISTLSDISAKAAKALEEGALSMTAGDDYKATASLSAGSATWTIWRASPQVRRAPKSQPICGSRASSIS